MNIEECYLVDVEPPPPELAMPAAAFVAPSDNMRMQMIDFAKNATNESSMEECLKEAEKLPALISHQEAERAKRLNHVYKLYLHLLALDDEELKRFGREKLKRSRGVRQGTEATVAIACCFRKSKSKARGLFSQWATKLIYAAANKVPLDEFDDKMSAVTLKTCREAAKEYREFVRGGKKPTAKSKPEQGSAAFFFGNEQYVVQMPVKLLEQLKTGKRKSINAKLFKLAKTVNPDVAAAADM